MFKPSKRTVCKLFLITSCAACFLYFAISAPYLYLNSPSVPTQTSVSEEYRRRHKIKDAEYHEFLDPASAFYGMRYKDYYGISLGDFQPRKYTKSKENWEKYFPGLMTALKEYRRTNPTKIESLFTYSATVSAQNTVYQIGDEFQATIQSFDQTGKPKTFGGDYYRARLKRDKKPETDGIPCHVFDLGNGTYKVKAPVALPGKFMLEVKLVTSLEYIDALITETSKLGSWSHTYLAQLATNETVVCNVNLSNVAEFKKFSLCDYGNPRNKEPWVCVKPPSGVCAPITWVAYHDPDKKKNEVYKKACRRCHVTIDTNIVITAQSRADDVILPPCSALFSPDSATTRPSGYYLNGHWRSLQCSNVLKSKSDLDSRMRNKVVYFFGDSTVRQFFYLVANRLLLAVTGPDNSVVWQQPKVARDNAFTRRNLTLYYRAHGPPLQNPGPAYSRPYVSDSIEGIPRGGEGVYVIFNIGAHLVNYEPSVYIHRLKGIRRAVLEHLRLFPGTRFIVRGTNVVQYPFEWFLLRHEVLLREIFKGIKNVAFANFWDMTTVWPLEDYHPMDNALDQEALVLLGYVCS